MFTPISSYQEDDVKKDTEKSVVQDTLCKNFAESEVMLVLTFLPVPHNFATIT